MSISKWNASLGLLFAFFASQAAAENGLTLVMGQLSFDGSYIKQVVSVKNERDNTVRSAEVECGFFRQGQLIATSSSFIDNVAPGHTGFANILASSNVGSDRAQCRVVTAP